MKKLLFMIVLASLVLSPTTTFVADAQEDDACDMKTVTKGLRCEQCEEIVLAKSLVSDVPYYVCPDCDEVYREPGTCDECEVALVKKVSGKGVCPDCLQKPTAVEICEKVCYVCPDCEMTASKAGKCPECEVALEKQTIRAVIIYECPDCGMSSYQAGKCTDESCEQHGKALKKRCSHSGEFPHGGSE